jgi:hypothetical protein
MILLKSFDLLTLSRTAKVFPMVKEEVDAGIPVEFPPCEGNPPFIFISKWQTFGTDSNHIGLPSRYITKHCGSHVEFLEGLSLAPASTETKNG